MSLNKSKHFMIVSGHPCASFEQDGKLFNAAGIEVDEEGNVLESLGKTESASIPQDLQKLTKKELVELLDSMRQPGAVFSPPVEEKTETISYSESKVVMDLSDPDNINQLAQKFEVTDGE